MSRVYRATRRRDGRVVAVKSVGLASEDVAWAERRGAELQRQFHAVDTRVPDVLDIRAGTHELLIEMEYIDGEDLLDRPALARPLHAERRRRGLGGPRRRARSRAPVRRGGRRRDLPRHRPRRSQAAQHPRLRRRRCLRARQPDAGIAGPRPRLRRRQGHPRRRRRDAQRVRQRALHVARAPDRRPRQHDERLLVARRRALRAPERRAALPGQRARRAPPDRQRSAGAPGRLPRRSRRAGPSSAGPRSGDAADLGRRGPRHARPLARDDAADVTGRRGRRPALPPLDVNPTRRTEAGIGQAATSPVSGARPLPPILGVPPLVPGPLPGPILGLHAGRRRHHRRRRRDAPHAAAGPGGRTRRCRRCRRSRCLRGTTRRPFRCRRGRPRRPVLPRAATPWRRPPVRAAAGASAAILGAAALWFLVWSTWKVGGEMRVWSESDLLGRKVHAAEPEALDEMVATYSSLSERSSLGFGTWPARQPLREALTLHVDRVILDFRQPEPTVRAEPVAAGPRVGGQGARDRLRRIAAGALSPLRRAREAHRRRRRDPQPRCRPRQSPAERRRQPVPRSGAPHPRQPRRRGSACCGCTRARAAIPRRRRKISMKRRGAAGRPARATTS